MEHERRIATLEGVAVETERLSEVLITGSTS